VDNSSSQQQTLTAGARPIRRRRPRTRLRLERPALTHPASLLPHPTPSSRNNTEPHRPRSSPRSRHPNRNRTEHPERHGPAAEVIPRPPATDHVSVAVVATCRRIGAAHRGRAARVVSRHASRGAPYGRAQQQYSNPTCGVHIVNTVNEFRALRTLVCVSIPSRYSGFLRLT